MTCGAPGKATRQLSSYLGPFVAGAQDASCGATVLIYFT
jgi:hypothetical protein